MEYFHVDVFSNEILSGNGLTVVFCSEELDFTGHPILGAAATIHSHFFRNEEDIAITFQLNKKTIISNSKKIENYYEVQMNQGKAELLCEVSKEKIGKYVHALNLSEENLSEEFPMEVVSTGLPYLLVPLTSGIENAKIIGSKFEEMLKEVGAKFAYIFNVNHIEGRSWDNQGRFVGRPSKIKVSISVSEKEILVAGDVAILAKGTILI